MPLRKKTGKCFSWVLELKTQEVKPPDDFSILLQDREFRTGLTSLLEARHHWSFPRPRLRSSALSGTLQA